jgi:type II secretory pathway component PulK
VLLVLVILIVVIGQMTTTSLQNRTLAQNHLAELQNAYGVRAGYAQALLYLQSAQDQSPNVDSFQGRWSGPISFDLGKGGHVDVTIQDCPRFISLYDLVNDAGEANPAVVDQLRRLVKILGHPYDVTDRIVDYVDADSRGAFEARAKNERLYNVEELLRIDGIAPEVVYGGMIGGQNRPGLARFVTAYSTVAPGGTAAPGQININTAPVEVLQSLSDDMTQAAAESIVTWRNQPGQDGKLQQFEKPEDLQKVPGLTPTMLSSISKQVVIKASTYQIKVRSTVGNIELSWIYVVRRGSGPTGGFTLLASQRLSDFLSVKPQDEDKP